MLSQVSFRRRAGVALACVLFLAAFVCVSRAQTPAARENAGAASADQTAAPLYKDYKGVTIGMTADEARHKLGKKGDSKTEDFFQMSDNEDVTLYYDESGKVKAILVMYTGKGDAPTDVAVLGEKVAADTNGRVYKLVRYPKSGYWVAYSRTAGDSPIITITLQRMDDAVTAAKK